MIILMIKLITFIVNPSFWIKIWIIWIIKLTMKIQIKKIFKIECLTKILLIMSSVTSNNY